MSNEDMTGKTHWDSVYAKTKDSSVESWVPKSYGELCIESFLIGEIERRQPQRILEIGCGNSTWLPYIARKTGLKVYGIDYSERGCSLARKNIDSAEVEGAIFCGDIFDFDISKIDKFDFVYSLGVVEHFSDLETVLERISEFVEPGGVLLTEIPNLFSVHGAFAKLYQPRLLSKHRVIRKSEIVSAYKMVGLEVVNNGYSGLFSMRVVAWGVEQRFPKLDLLIIPFVRVVSKLTDILLKKIGLFKGSAWLAPYIYVTGVK